MQLPACRFDFPGQWPSLLSDLGGAAAWGSPMPAVAKLRMLFTLKNVLRALRSKRFVVEAPASVAGLSQQGEHWGKGLDLENGGVLEPPQSPQTPLCQTYWGCPKAPCPQECSGHISSMKTLRSDGEVVGACAAAEFSIENLSQTEDKSDVHHLKLSQTCRFGACCSILQSEADPTCRPEANANMQI